MGVRRTGDWEKARMTLTGMGVRIRRETDKLSRSQAMRAKNMLVRAVEGQSFNHAPLADSTKRQKARLGLDPRTLIATGKYLNSFKVWKVAEGRWVVGVQSTAKTSRGENYTNIGTWLEYGTKNMPARPHWRPVREELRKDIPSKAKLAIRKGVLGK